MTVTLPEELAPALRARAEALLAEVELHTVDHTQDRPAPRGTYQPRCHVCKERGGRLGTYKLGDGTPVQVHPRCHRKLQRG